MLLGFDKRRQLEQRNSTNCWAMNGSRTKKRDGVPSHHLGNTMRAAGSLCKSYALHQEEIDLSGHSGNSSSLKIGAEMEKKILARAPFSTNRQNSDSILQLGTTIWLPSINS